MFCWETGSFYPFTYLAIPFKMNIKLKQDEIKFHPTTEKETLAFLKEEWQQTLTSPQDGMWETLTDLAAHWHINKDNQIIGYACINLSGWLLQFYIQPACLPKGISILKQFIQDREINMALIGTNNPVALSLAMHFQKQIEIHTYLFTHYFETELSEHQGEFDIVRAKNLENLVNFLHDSLGSPKDWLKEYVSKLIEKNEMFFLKKGNEILGTCEVRKSASQPDIADVGMVVAPDQRNKGLGTYLLGKAKGIALEQGKQPVCSCEKNNIGSLKAIHNNGFRSTHQMLLMEF